jgi:PAS domain S-box-containing protein
MEDSQIFDQQIEVAYQRLHKLMEHSGGSPEQQGVIGGALEALSTSLEELHVAGEELRQQNEELAAARQLLETERQRYQELFEFAPDGYLVTDAKGIVREANRAAAELLRAPQANLVGKPLTTYVVRDERAAFRSQLALLAEAERMVDWEVHLKPRGAQPFPASITVAAAHGVQGEAAGFRWQVRDITRRKQGQSRREALLEALRQARDELEIRVQERTAELQAEVAEREAAQAALKQERDFVSAALDTVGALVVVLDREGRIVRFNRACQQTTGYAFDEVEGRCCWDFLLVPEEVEPVRATFDELQGGQFPNEFENYWVARDGSRRLIAWTNTAIPGPDGQVEYIIGTGLDVTEHRRAQSQREAALSQREAALEALRESEERFRMVADFTYDWEYWVGVDGRYLYISPSCERITGYRADEFTQNPGLLETIVHPDDRTAVGRHLNELFESNEATTVDFRILTRAGEERWISHVCTPVYGADGRSLGRRASNRDITQRKRAEEKLQSEEERFRLAAESLSDVIYEWDIGSNVQWFGNIDELLGYAPGEFPRTLEAWLDLLHPEDRAQVWGAVERHLRDETAYNIEYRVRHKCGDWRHWLDRGAALRDASGHPYRWIGAVTDTTARKQAESQREAALAERERHMAHLDALIRISQEILAEKTVGGLLQCIVDAARELTGARLGVAGHDYRDGVFEVGAASRAEGMAACPPGALLTIQQGGVYLELIERAASIRLTDEELRARPAWWGLPEGHTPLRGLLGARLVGRDGQAAGLIMVSDKDGGSDFSAEDEALLAQLAALASLAMQHIRARDEAEQRADELDTVFSAITEAVVVFDAEGRVVRANPAANAFYGAELTGADRATIVQRLFLRHPDGCPVIAQELAAARALRGERVRGERFILTAADGHDMTILISAAPLLADGRLTGSVVVWRDATERERLLEENRRQREFMERLLEIAPIGVAVVRGPDHRFEFVNAYYQAIPGIPDMPMVGHTVAEVFPAAVAQGTLREIEAVYQTGQTVSVREYEANAGPGRERTYWDSDRVPLKTPDGSVEGVLIVAHEVTEEVLARRQVEELAARDEAILNSLTEGIITVDLEGNVLMMNPAALRIHGFEQTEQAPRPQDLPDVFDLHGLDGRRLPMDEWPLERLRRGETFSGYEVQVRRLDNEATWIGSYGGAPVRDAAGDITMGVLALRDVTAQKQAELERERLLEELKAALAEKEVLMREIYHRVKNNIQTLIYLMDMQTEFITDPDSRAMIHELQVRARTMSLVHEQLYQSGNLAQVDFGAYLNDLMANLLRAFWADRPIIWDIDAADVLLGVDIAIPCGLIVNELLTNALKYAFPNAQPVVERGETECKIRVEFRAEGNRFTLVVADNGVGLPPGVDWSTTKSLGMQLINVLACHQLGGQVEVDTQAGTTFTITFVERKKR